MLIRRVPPVCEVLRAFGGIPIPKLRLVASAFLQTPLAVLINISREAECHEVMLADQIIAILVEEEEGEELLLLDRLALETSFVA